MRNSGLQHTRGAATESETELSQREPSHLLSADPPDLERNALKRDGLALALARRAQRLVVERQTARGRAVRERLVQPQPVVAVATSRCQHALDDIAIRKRTRRRRRYSRARRARRSRSCPST